MAAAATMDAAASLREQTAAFHEHGFVCLRGALQPATVRLLLAAIDRSRAEDPSNWELRGPGAAGWRPLDAQDGGSAALGSSAAGSVRQAEIAVGEAGRYQTMTGSLLRFSDAFDAALCCEPVVSLVDELMGSRMVCTSLDAMWRAPVPEPPPPGEHAHHQMWHREAGGVSIANFY